MKILLMAAALGFVLPAFAAQAMWTGKSEMVTTMGGQPGTKCEYNYNGQRFYKVFPGMGCPSSVEVQ